MGYQTVPAQRELFPRATPRISLPPEVTRRLLLLVERLLAETASCTLAAKDRVDE